MDSIIQTKFGGFVSILAITFGAGAIVFFFCMWLGSRFSDPKWLKMHAPLFAFLAVTLKVFLAVMGLISKALGYDNPAIGIVWVLYLLFVAACVGAWRRYLIAHPDGPPPTLPPPVGNSLSILNLDPNLDAPQASKPLENSGVPE